MTAPRVPRQLTDKYEALLAERNAALARIEELDRELDYLNVSVWPFHLETGPCYPCAATLAAASR